jgi:sn-glycerol 3-phosphate transport system permease protein
MEMLLSNNWWFKVRSRSISTFFIHLPLIALCFLAVWPFYWMLLTSFRSETMIFSDSMIPWPITLSNYPIAAANIPLL